jgi:ribose-phosphate pyrophosphokinase
MRIIYTTEDYRYMREELLKSGAKLAKGDTERAAFPDGETYRRVKDKTAGHHCIILAGLQSDSNFMEVCELSQYLVEHDAKKLTIIIPYFGYSTMERATKSGELVKAKYRCDMLSRLPRASYGNRIVMMDLHADQMIHYFHGLTTYHIDNRNIVIKAASDMVQGPYVIAATDVGRAKHIEYLARLSNMEPAYVYKRRDSGTQTEVTGANCDVKDKDVVIYDDMIRSGGSLMKAAEIYKNLGAKRIFVATTHVPMRGGVEKLIANPIIEKVSIMNTTPVANEIAKEYPDKINLYSVVNNIVEWMKY